MPKQPYIHPSILKKIEQMNKAGKKRAFKTWSRSSMIYPQLVGHTIGVHNGKKHIPVFVTEDMIGHKLGEFAKTRTFRQHGVKGKATTSGGSSSAVVFEEFEKKDEVSSGE
jgi:small subunit ribosomal protein S19